MRWNSFIQVGTEPSLQMARKRRHVEVSEEFLVWHHIERLWQVDLEKNCPIRRFLLVEAVCNVLIEVIEGRGGGVVLIMRWNGTPVANNN